MMTSASSADDDGVCRWSSLPGHLLEEIAIHALIAPKLTESESVEDFMTFRKVCTDWRAAATKDLFVASYSRASQLPCLMLPEKEEGSNEREFFNVFAGKFCCKVSLPEVSGKRCIEARFGWLLTLAYSGEVQLFNPVSRSCIQLPSFKLSRGFFDKLNPPYLVFRRAVLSANPSETSDFVLAVRTNSNMMEFWRNGDESWSRPDKPYEGVDSIQDIMYSERDRVFYGICGSGLIYSWDTMGGDRIDRICRVCGMHTGVRSVSVQGYLMESPLAEDGDLLLVSPNGQTEDGGYGATIFRVFRINVKDKTMEPLRRLKDEAIFVGHNAAVCVQASKFGGLVKSSCIYFSDDSIDAYIISLRKNSKDEEDSEKNQEGSGKNEGEPEEEEGKDEKDSEKNQEESGKNEGGQEEEEGKDEDENMEEGDEDENMEEGEEDEEDDDEDDGEEDEDEDDGEGEGEIDADEYQRRENEFFWGGASFDPSKGGGKNMGIYNLEDRSIERFDECVERLSLVCPAVWITPPSLIA